MSPFGLATVLMSLLIGAAAFNTGTNLLYVMLSLLLALFSLSFLLGWFNLNRLTLRRVLPHEIYAGQSTEFQVLVRNSKRWLGSYGIAIEERVNGAKPRPLGAYVMAVPSHGTAVARQRATFARRGIYRFEGARLGSLFPFGLIEFRSWVRDAQEILVYPEIVPVGKAPHVTSRGMGGEERAEKGRGAGLHSVREYTTGDPARDIHWRLSAKGTGLKLREYESESAEGIQLVFDSGKPADRDVEEIERFEKAISQTASLARHYLTAGVEVSLWTAAGFVPRGTGPAQLKRILRSLALLDPEQLNPHAIIPPPREDVTQVWVSGPGGRGHAGGTLALQAGRLVFNAADPSQSGEPASPRSEPANGVVGRRS